MERVSFTTSDGVRIVGDWQKPVNATHAMLLLHMMPAVRSSWAPLSDALSDAGIASLAIDLRGHGESTMDGTLDFNRFKDEDHQKSRLDVDASLKFLQEHGFDKSAVSVAGASIGSNLTIDALARYPEITKGVSLSPGLDYRGVLTEPLITQLKQNQHVWLMSAEQDHYSDETVKILHTLRPDVASVVIYVGEDHGTDLFEDETELVGEIVRFVSQK